MENPNTWTPLHWALHDAYYQELGPLNDPRRLAAIKDVLFKNDINVSAEDIQEVIDEHNQEMDEEEVCGLSLPSKLVNRFIK